MKNNKDKAPEKYLFFTSDQHVFLDADEAAAHAAELDDATVAKRAIKPWTGIEENEPDEIDALLDRLSGIE